MKIKNNDTNKDVKISQCRNNHIPAKFTARARKVFIMLDGRPATMMTCDATVKYIILQDCDGFNFYSYDWTIVGSSNFSIVM